LLIVLSKSQYLYKPW